MVIPADLHTTQLVLREARYYQLTGLIQLLEGQAKRLQSDKALVRVNVLTLIDALYMQPGAHNNQVTTANLLCAAYQVQSAHAGVHHWHST